MTMTRPTTDQITHEGKLLSTVLGNAPVNVKAFGATGDGVTDDTVAVQAALDAAAGGEIVFAPGTYLVYALKVPGNTTVNLSTATVKKRPAVSGDLGVRDFTGSTVFINTIMTISSVPGYAPIFYLIGNDIVFKGGTIDGNRANDTLNTSVQWGGSIANFATRAGILGSVLAVPSLGNLTVDGVRFVNMVGVGIDAQLSGELRICNCTEVNNGQLLAHVLGGTECIVTGNTMAGDRAYSPIPNPGVYDSFTSLLFSNNTVDQTGTATDGGVKFQNSDDVVVSSNTWIDSYIKPASSPSFKCRSFSVIGNTFVNNSPGFHIGGMANWIMPCRALVVSGNSFVNSACQVSRDSDSVTISGNSFVWTIDPNLSANSQSTIGGQNTFGPAGKAVISNNTFDGGGFDGVHFFGPPIGGGINILSGNLVTNTDTIIPQTSFTGASIGQDTRYDIIDNTFLNYRAFGRVILPVAMGGVMLKGNYFGNISALTPNNQLTARRGLQVTFASSGTYTVDMIAIEANTWDSSHGAVAFTAPEIATSTSVTIASMIVQRNSMLFAEAANGRSFAMPASSTTFTNVHIRDNYMLGDFQFSSGATVTNEYVGTNQFGAFGSTQRKITNLAQKAVGMTGTLTTTVGSAGAASALPATPTGYVTTVIDGTARKVPYYAS